MNEKYSIVFKKDGSTMKKGLLSDFGMVCTDFPILNTVQVKDPYKNDWKDANGDDIYVPGNLKLQGYDVEIGICYKGNENTTNNAIDSLVAYLTGRTDNVSMFSMYNSNVNAGRQKCYFVSTSSPEFFRTQGIEIAEFKLKIHVCDPITNITL